MAVKSGKGAGQRPNILVILSDDMGYGDVSAHGHPWFKTPNFDRLYRQSVRMTDFMVSPTCAPTRAALMTGAHEFHSGVTHTILGMEQMNKARTTVANVLSAAGYDTGMFGKWHLGDTGSHVPWCRGFGVGVIAKNDAAGAQRKAVDPVFLFNGEERRMRGVRDVLFAEEAMKFMAQDRKKPFFCYFATYDPHAPFQAEDRFMEEMRRQVEAAKKKGILGVNEKRVDFFAEVLQTDWILGRLMDFLEEKGLVKNTLVFVMNDNGGTCGVDAFNAGMRGDKGTAWLGGTRAYAFWRLPGVLEPRDVTESCAHIDVLPTLAEVAGASIGNLQDQVEGRSAWGLLTGKDPTWPERNLYAHVARWKPGKRDAHQYEGAMVRRGNYDLVRVKTAIGRDGYSDHPEFHRAATPGGDWALYDRKADPAKEHNLADRHPELVQRLSADFERWWADSRKYLIHENDASGTKNVPK
jgi:arylsulfatase